jgi:transposase-like protein
MPRVARSKWAEARIKWETSPDVTYSDIARELGVKPATVHERARRERWVKVANFEARPVGIPAPESVEAYKENTRQIAKQHAEMLARARADIEVFRAKLMRAIEAAKDSEIIKYSSAFSTYLDKLYMHILREREVWGMSDGAAEIRIVRRGWIVVGNGSSNGNGSSD